MKSTSSLRDDSGGFTLIEVLVAVSITVVVLAMLYGSFFQVMVSERRVETELELMQEVSSILSRMRHDLVNIFPRGSLDPEGSPLPDYHRYFAGSLQGENSRIVFTSFAKDPSHHSSHSGQSEISYYLVPVRRERRDMFALVRKDNYWIGNDAAGAAYPVSERVLSFRANFISKDAASGFSGGQKLWEWDSSVRKGLPEAVQVTIVFLGDGGREETHSMTVAIPVAN